MKLAFTCLLLFIPLNSIAGQIAFTFDDAPMGDSAVMSGQQRTDRLIKAIKSAAIPDALFFVKADAIDASGDKRLKQYIQAGFHLANHSYAHQSANKIPVNAFLIDAYTAHLKLKNYSNVLPYFRFPYLHYGQDAAAIDALQAGLLELGYQNGYVTIDNFDWYMNALLNNAKKDGKAIDYEKFGALYVEVIWQAIVFYDELAVKTLGRSPKHVLLLHENDTAALFLAKLARHIRQQGWEIITPQQAYSDPIAAELPVTHFHKQGRIAAMANAKGTSESLLRHPAENQQYLDKLFKDGGVFGDKSPP